MVHGPQNLHVQFLYKCTAGRIQPFTPHTLGFHTFNLQQHKVFRISSPRVKPLTTNFPISAMFCIFGSIRPKSPSFFFRVIVLHTTLLVILPSVLLVQRNQVMSLFILASLVLSQIQQESVCHNVYSNT